MPSIKHRRRIASVARASGIGRFRDVDSWNLRSITTARLLGWAGRKLINPRTAAMARRAEDHFNHSDQEYSRQRNGPGHCRVIGGPETRQAWIIQRSEGSRKQMDKRSRNKNPSSEMRDEKEKRGRDTQTGEPDGEDRKGTGQSRNREHDEQTGNMKRKVILGSVGATLFTGRASGQAFRFRFLEVGDYHPGNTTATTGSGAKMGYNDRHGQGGQQPSRPFFGRLPGLVRRGGPR